MLMEIRIYKIRPGMRQKFIEFFESKTIHAQEACGMRILGQFRSLQDDNVFVWLRAFDDAADRDVKKEAFYGGPLWLEELEEEAVSMIDDYSNVLLVEPTAASRLR